MRRRKRTPIDEPGRTISARAVMLFKSCLKLRSQGYSEDSDEFRGLSLELRRELGLKPWDWDVFEVGSIGEDGEPPDDPSHLRDWLMVRNIRRKLISET